MFMIRKTLPFHFRVKTANWRARCTMTCVFLTFLPSICFQMTTAWSSPLLKLVEFFFFFRTYSEDCFTVANFFVLSLPCSISSSDILWIFSKKRIHIGDCIYSIFHATMDKRVNRMRYSSAPDCTWLPYVERKTTHKSRQLF